MTGGFDSDIGDHTTNGVGNGNVVMDLYCCIN